MNFEIPVEVKDTEPDASWYDKDNEKNVGLFDDSWKFPLFMPYIHGKVLDIGCNEGKLLKAIPFECSKYGIDISSFAIERARASNPGDEITFWVSDAYNIPESWLNFDTIIVSDVIEHLTDPVRALPAWKERLRKNGRILILTPNLLNFQNLERISKGEQIPSEPRAHINMMTYWKLKDMALKAGMKIGFVPLSPTPVEIDIFLFAVLFL
jgi:SAM-dependent methyltransferase